MITRVSFILAALVAAGLMAGCSKAPTAQFETSKTAIEGAKLAEAEQYAPDLFKAASDSLNLASAEIQKEEGRFSMLRDYDRAQAILTSAQKLADDAKAAAEVEKEKVRQYDSALIIEIDSLIVQTKDGLAKAPKGKGTRLDLKVLQTDLDGAVGALAAAKTEFESGKFLTARDMLQAVKAQITKVKGEVDTALARTKK